MLMLRTTQAYDFKSGICKRDLVAIIDDKKLLSDYNFHLFL